jgi:hypothetical protein
MSERDSAVHALKARFERDAIEEASRGARQRRRMLPDGPLVGLIIAILVLSPMIVGLVFFGMQTAQQFAVSNTVGRFCQAEEGGNFTAAYRLLSRRARASMSSDDLAQATGNANLLTCLAAQESWRINVASDQTKVPVWFLQTSVDQRSLGAITLIREHGDWHIDTVSSDVFNLP